MNAAMPMHFEREEPGILGPLALAVLVHLLLIGVLFVGVRWQSRPLEPVSVELWSPPTEFKPAIKPVVKPEPRVEPLPPPPPKPEPKLELPKPVIAVPEKPKPLPKPVPKPVPKPKLEPAPPKPRDVEMQKKLSDDIARAQTELRLEQERELVKDQLAREQAVLRQGALAAYTGKIKAKIKGNIVMPPNIKGNPEAIFEVVQLPTGEVLTVKLVKSSGHSGYDAAVERATLKSSPLPKPDKGELFYRVLTLSFKPLE